MKVKNWNEKAIDICDRLTARGDMRYYNRADGALITDKKGFYALFLPGCAVMSAFGNKKNERAIINDTWEKTINGNAKIADHFSAGYFKREFSCETEYSNKIRVLSNDITTVYVQEKFLRMFPANTLYYIEDPRKPVIAGIWENGLLHIIGIVLPFYNDGRYEFTSKKESAR